MTIKRARTRLYPRRNTPVVDPDCVDLKIYAAEWSPILRDCSVRGRFLLESGHLGSHVFYSGTNRALLTKLLTSDTTIISCWIAHSECGALKHVPEQFPTTP